MEKIRKPIAFSEVLDIGQFLSGSCNGVHKDTCKYKLFALIVHSGHDLFEGHYYAYVKGVNGNWFKADDESITPTPIENVLKQNAYILFYQSINSLKKVENVPLVKSKVETQKLANTMVNDLFGTKGKHQKQNSNLTPINNIIKVEEKTLVHDNIMKDDTKENSINSNSDLKNKEELIRSNSTDKSEPKVHHKASKLPIFKNGLKRIRYLNQALIKYKKPKYEEPLKISQQYFNANSEIFSWEDTKRPSFFEKLMVEESKSEKTRKRHIIDEEYDKGKLKKVKNKKKFEGLQYEFDNIQRFKL